jgi:hypothetical protein
VGERLAAAPELTAAQRAGRVQAVGGQIERSRPMLFARPELQFPLSSATRQAASRVSHERQPQPLHVSAASSWAGVAAGEQWIVDAKGAAPAKLLSVVTALEKPTLDGRLDEPLWQIARPVALSGIVQDGQELPVAAVLAFDDEFLYLAVSCAKAAGGDDAADNQPRPHDSDLAQRDHVTLLLDVDRDYSTWWQLSIDHRGYPAASCAGDAAWNPNWFIAAAGDQSWWTIEAAIPLVELGPHKPQVRDVWAAQIQRVVPKLGVASFGQPAAVQIRPEGFGLMVFE